MSGSCQRKIAAATWRQVAFAADRDQAGTNVLDCDPESARTQLQEMLASGKANIYTIEKAGKRKLIYQASWYVDGEYAGIVELTLPIPD